jgi:hypothetical protein|tara:strand:- start:75 stop:596 length:522 start_codon:yes stop_codon:yes gene_type:complete
MQTETSDLPETIAESVAGQIAHWHTETQRLVSETRATAGEAMQAAVNTGAYLQDSKKFHKGQAAAWLRDNVPDVTHEQVKAYLSIYKTSEERKAVEVDHRQLLLLGVIDQKEMEATKRTSSQVEDTKWADWAANITGWWNKTRITKPLNQWTEGERGMVKQQLKPVVDIFNSL